MDWHLAGDVVITTGPIEDVSIGRDISWDVHSKQGVHLIPKHRNVNVKKAKSVQSAVKFDSSEGELIFQFSVLS